jgi:excisionase family DNA binding protein
MNFEESMSIYRAVPSSQEEPILINLATAARLLDVGQTMLREKVHADEIPHLRLGNRIKFNREQLLEWARRNTRGDHPQE